MTYSLLALTSAIQTQRLPQALRRIGREVSALLDALTSPVAFVAEVEALHVKPGRAEQA